MPILAREPDIFPDALLEDAVAFDDVATWWAIYTRSRREKELMRHLRRMGVAFYGPLVPRRTRSPAGRVRVSHVPLFPGYVFVRGSEQDRSQAVTTNCVSRCLPVPDAARLVHDLAQIRRLLESEEPVVPESRLEPGMRVRVAEGALQGLEGRIIRRHGRDQLLVTVEFLQQGASVRLDCLAVERVD